MNRAIISFLLLTSNLFGIETLPEPYLVTYGDENASMEVVQFYSLSCAHCIQLFNQDFPMIKKEFVDQGKLRYVFHPAPMDLTTVQFMCCLEKLDNQKKALLLSALFQELSLDNPSFNIVLMKKAMELFGIPLNDLENDALIQNSQAFKCAGDFIIQNGVVKTIPSIRIGDKVIEKVPDYPFISMIMKRFVSKDYDYEH